MTFIIVRVNAISITKLLAKWELHAEGRQVNGNLRRDGLLIDFDSA